MENTQLQSLATQTRRDILRMVHAVNSGHPGGSMGCADFFVLLYHEILQLKDGFSMDGVNEDVFFLSNGHISPVWYSTLARRGFFPLDELKTFRKIDTRLQGHPTTHEGLPGIRVASGSLGQGLSVGIGSALTKKLNGDKHLVYTLHGDGELQEGQIWEAVMFAAHHKVDNLIATVDYNGQQIDGGLEDVMSLGDLAGKWKAFGWKVVQVDGHNHDELFHALSSKNTTGKPLCIICTTTKGKGVSFMENNNLWHYRTPQGKEYEMAKKELEEI